VTESTGAYRVANPVTSRGQVLPPPSTTSADMIPAPARSRNPPGRFRSVFASRTAADAGANDASYLTY